MATLYHAKHLRDSIFYSKNGMSFNQKIALDQFHRDLYEKVATFPDDLSLEEIWMQTQNIHEPWRDPPCRSTAVGDIIEQKGRLFIVATVGYDELTGD